MYSGTIEPTPDGMHIIESTSSGIWVYKENYHNGVKHRTDGPAVIYNRKWYHILFGLKKDEWWINGEYLDFVEYCTENRICKTQAIVLLQLQYAV